MGFEASHTNTNDNSDRPSVDYSALHKYMVETCGLEDEKTVVGIISGIIDLGIQTPEYAKMECNMSKAQEEAELDKFPGSWFMTDDLDGKRYKCWNKKPVQSVAITVDFPGIIVDKAKFYEEGSSAPAPLRMLLNGTFFRKAEPKGFMDVGKLFTTECRKNEKTNNQWSFLPNNTLYKLAVGAGVIKQGQPFTNDIVINLLGKALLFKARAHINKGGYYNEKVSFAAGLIDGMTVPSYDTNLLYSVGFNSNNDDKAIQFLTAPIINRMKLSTQYMTSNVRKQIEVIHPYQKIVDGTVTVTPNNVAPKAMDIPSYDPQSMPF